MLCSGAFSVPSTEAGADISGWRQPDAMEAGSKEVGDFAIGQNLRLF